MWKNLKNGEEPEVGSQVLVYNQWNDDYNVMYVHRDKFDGSIRFSNSENPDIFTKTTGTFWMELPEKPSIDRGLEETTEEVDSGDEEIPCSLEMFDVGKFEPLTETQLRYLMSNLHDVDVDSNDASLTTTEISIVRNGTLEMCGRTYVIENANVKLNTIFPEPGIVVCQLNKENEEYITKWFEMIGLNVKKSLENILVKVNDYVYYKEFTDWDMYCELHGIINARDAKIETKEGRGIILHGVHPVGVNYSPIDTKIVTFSYDYATINPTQEKEG